MIRINDPLDLEEVNPVESKEFPGYYHFPDEPVILVNENAEILNSRNGNQVIGFVNSTGGRTVSFWVKGKCETWSVHRIVARTFIGRPSRHLDKEYKDLVVNHVNCIRTDNCPENLEWVTGKENTRHAVDSGLFSTSKTVLVLDAKTLKLYRIESISSCADFLEIHRATLHKALKKPGIHKRKWFFIKIDDGDEFVINEKTHYSVIDVGEDGYAGRLVQFTVKETGQKIVFKNLFTASKALDFPLKRVYRTIRKTGEWENEIYLIQDIALTH